jgi:Flp pilus assembly protein TadG
MASFSRKSGIVGALIIAAVLIGGAFILSSNPSTFFHAQVADAESTQQLLQDYSQKDSDHDGLPDWEEALYGTDPYNAHSFSPTLTDGQAVAEGLIKPKFTTTTEESSTTDAAEQVPGIAAASGSLTDEFAQQFFGQYISQQTGDTDSQPTDADIDTYAQQAMQQFISDQQQPDKFSASDLNVASAGTVTMASYAASAQAAFASNTTNFPETGIEYFSDAVEKNDTTATSKLSQIGSAYSAIAQGLIAISVPSEAQYAHLEIINALSHLGDDFTDMSAINSDPLKAYVGFSAYQTDAASLAEGFSDMNVIFTSENITLSPTDPGYDFYTTATGTPSQ